MKAAFDNEAEIERVVQEHAEQLFGTTIVYLPQTRISTIGGRGTVPDAVVIDVAACEWYIVEAERAIHGTWEHIAPQVARHLAAIASPRTAETLIQMTLNQLRSNPEVKSVFQDAAISELEAHGRVQNILRKSPMVAIPIDSIPKDLNEWIQTLRNVVKVWVIEKFVSTTDASRILYSLPDENFPTLSTSPVSAGAINEVRTSGSQPPQELLAAMPGLIGAPLTLDYGPRGSERRNFQGTLRADGVEVDGKILSPSYAAVYCMQKAGSPRKTANGWKLWWVNGRDLLDDLYNRTRSNAPQVGADQES